jgi:hypothetical protein
MAGDTGNPFTALQINILDPVDSERGSNDRTWSLFTAFGAFASAIDTPIFR